MKMGQASKGENRNPSRPPPFDKAQDRLTRGREFLHRQMQALNKRFSISSLTRRTGEIHRTSQNAKDSKPPRSPHLGRSYRLPLITLAGLGLVGIAAWWFYQTSQTAPPPRPQPAARTPTAAAAPTSPQASTAPAEPPPVTDIFAVRNWEPPPPAPPPTPSTGAANAPPPPPEPPPLPFRYLGRIVEAGKADAFLLAQGNRVIAVSVGNVIDGTYRVEKYENGQLYFLYQPMKAHQALAIGTMGNPS